jgi:hypothetical protein
LTGDAAAFEVAAFGMLYDRTLRGRVEGGSGGRIVFTSELKKGMPIGVIVGFVLAVYPGVLLTDTLIGMYFPAYPDSAWVTAAWYVPLTLLAAPALWKQFRMSEASSRAHAEETIEKIAATLGGRVEAVGDDAGG